MHNLKMYELSSIFMQHTIFNRNQQIYTAVYTNHLGAFTKSFTFTLNPSTPCVSDIRDGFESNLPE